MKRIRIILALAVIVCFSFQLASCGGKYDEAEIIDASRSLIEQSYEINNIYFGEGLAIDEEELAYAQAANGAEKDYEEKKTDMNYYAVDSECGYSSVSDIKEATLEVYTEEYSNYLFELAFSGFSVEIGENDNTKEQAVAYARYIDNDFGLLAERIVGEEEKLELSRTYDLDGIEVQKQRSGYVMIKVPSYVGGEKSDDVELKLKMTDSGWRLDTPTY